MSIAIIIAAVLATAYGLSELELFNRKTRTK